MFEGIKALVHYACQFPKLLTTIKDTRMFAKYENWCKKLQDKIIKRREKKVLRELENLRLDIITDVLTLRTSLESLASYAYFDDDPYAQKVLMNLEQELKVILASYRVALKKER